MILELYAILTALSLVMIFIGISNPDESAYALIGFGFLFALAMFILEPGQLQLKSGENTTTTFNYNPENLSVLDSTVQKTAYEYNHFDDSTSRWFARLLAFGSVAGFVGVLLGLKGLKKKPMEDPPDEGAF